MTFLVLLRRTAADLWLDTKISMVVYTPLFALRTLIDWLTRLDANLFGVLILVLILLFVMEVIVIWREERKNKEYAFREALIDHWIKLMLMVIGCYVLLRIDPEMQNLMPGIWTETFSYIVGVTLLTMVVRILRIMYRDDRGSRGAAVRVMVAFTRLQPMKAIRILLGEDTQSLRAEPPPGGSPASEPTSSRTDAPPGAGDAPPPGAASRGGSEDDG